VRIGELAKLSDCSIQTIRFYEKEALLSEPERSEGNFRLYGSKTLDQLLFIKHCRELDLSLAEVRQLLSLQKSPDACCDNVNNMVDAHIQQVDARIRALRNLKSQLQMLRLNCRGAQAVKDCGILQGLKEA